MTRILTFLPKLQRFLMLAAFFLVPWWLWYPVLGSTTYTGYLLAWVVLLSVAIWIVLGVPGLVDVFKDRRRWWALAVFGIVLWAFLSPHWSLNPSASAITAQRFGAVGLFAIAALCAGPSARSVGFALAAGVIVQGVIALTQMQVQHPLGISALGEWMPQLSVVLSGDNRLLRPYGLTLHPNTLGGYALAALLCLTGWLSVDRGLAVWRLVVRALIMALALWVLLISFSRSAWGGLIVGIIVLLIFWAARIARPVLRRAALAAVIGVVLVGLFGLTYSNYIWARTAGITDGTDNTEIRSVSDRLVYMSIAFQVIQQHPILGVGIGAFTGVSGDLLYESDYDLNGDNVHNVPLLVWSELGLVGLGIWLFAWSSGLLLAIRRVRDPYAVGLLAGILGLLATSLLDHYTWSSLQFGVMLWGGMAVVLAQATRDKNAVQTPTS